MPNNDKQVRIKTRLTRKVVVSAKEQALAFKAFLEKHAEGVFLVRSDADDPIMMIATAVPLYGLSIPAHLETDDVPVWKAQLSSFHKVISLGAEAAATLALRLYFDQDVEQSHANLKALEEIRAAGLAKSARPAQISCPFCDRGMEPQIGETGEPTFVHPITDPIDIGDGPILIGSRPPCLRVEDPEPPACQVDGVDGACIDTAECNPGRCSGSSNIRSCAPEQEDPEPVAEARKNGSGEKKS